MAFWRMQLHPNDASNALRHTSQSLAAGFIGLDFLNPPGDLTDVAASDIEASQRGGDGMKDGEQATAKARCGDSSPSASLRVRMTTSNFVAVNSI